MKIKKCNPLMMHDNYHITHQESEDLLFIDDVVDVGSQQSVRFIHKECMFITSIIENSDEFSSAKINSNWAYSQIGESLTISVGWSSTTFPSIGSSFNLNPNGLLYPMPNLPTQPGYTLHQQILSSLATAYISRQTILHF